MSSCGGGLSRILIVLSSLVLTYQHFVFNSSANFDPKQKSPRIEDVAQPVDYAKTFRLLLLEFDN